MRHVMYCALWLGLWAVLAGCSGGTTRPVAAPDDQKTYDALPQLRTLDEFKQYVESSKKPVLVDFYATWCGPCRELAPEIGSLSSDYRGRVTFYRVDVDQARELSDKFGIKTIPTVFIFSGGQSRRFSFETRDTYVKALDQAVSQASATQSRTP